MPKPLGPLFHEEMYIELSSGMSKQSLVSLTTYVLTRIPNRIEVRKRRVQAMNRGNF